MTALRNVLGRWRAHAVWRILAFLLLFLTGIWFVILAIGIVAGVLFLAVDAVLQLWSNDRGWEVAGQSGVEEFLNRTAHWPFQLAQYVFAGGNQLPWHPYRTTVPV